MANWAKGLDELGAGLLRQADIGGRAYEGAMAKEAEARAETRALSAERRALAAAEAEEIRKNKEWRLREGISKRTAEGAATNLAGVQGDLQDDRIKGFKDAAELVATESKRRRGEDRTWAVDDAVKKAKSEQAKERIKASVSRAEKAEAKVTELYKGLPEANAEWDPETQSWKSGGAYMDMIYRAQDLAAAAWKATGITALMSERNINEPKFSYLSSSIASGISYDLKEEKPDVWKALVEGLHSDKGSADYEEAIKTITPYLNDAIKLSGIRTTSTEKAAIIEEIIEFMGGFAKYDQLEKDLGGAETASDVEGDPKNKVIVEAFSEDRLYKGGVWVGKAVDSIIESFKNIGDIESQVQLGAVAEQIRKWETEDFWNPNSRKWETRENLKPEEVIARIQEQVLNAPERYREAWSMFLEQFLNLPETGEDLGNGESGPPIGNGESGSPIQKRFDTGMLNTGGGMISSGGLSPTALAQWEPEAVEARQQQRTA